jgi:hypothetical protein
MINGQILSNSSFGQNILEIITNYSPATIVEIGTWKGMGSTKCIIDGIIKNNLDKTNFISIESSQLFYNEAIDNLKEYNNYVTLIHGKIIEIDEIINFCKLNQNIVDINNNWLIEDLYNMIDIENILYKLPKHIDFLLLDGGEYSTYVEWQKLKDRTHIVALDDIKTTKNKQIHKDLSLDNSYENIVMSDERNGYSIYKKSYQNE